MGRTSTSPGLTLDTGALIAIDRADPRIRQLLRDVLAAGGSIDVPTGVIAQAWRDGARQPNLARFLKGTDVREVPMESVAARAVGVVCGRSGHSDVVDVHVAVHALRHGHVAVTSDPDDLRKVAADLRLVTI